MLKMQGVNSNSTTEIPYNNMGQQYYQETPGQLLGSKAPPRDPSFSNANSGNSVLQLKRKKIKELIMGSGATGAAANRANNYALNAIEKEDL